MQYASRQTQYVLGWDVKRKCKNDRLWYYWGLCVDYFLAGLPRLLGDFPCSCLVTSWSADSRKFLRLASKTVWHTKLNKTTTLGFTLTKDISLFFKRLTTCLPVCHSCTHFRKDCTLATWSVFLQMKTVVQFSVLSVLNVFLRLTSLATIRQILCVHSLFERYFDVSATLLPESASSADVVTLCAEADRHQLLQFNFPSVFTILIQLLKYPVKQVSECYLILHIIFRNIDRCL